MPDFRKRIIVSTIIAFLAQNTLTPIVSAADFAAAGDTQARVMLYVSKSFGGGNDIAYAPKFGLRYESNAIDTGLRRSNRWSAAPRVSIVDLRWSVGYERSLRVLDMPVYTTPLRLYSTEGSSTDSMSGEVDSLGSFGGWGKGILLSVAALGVLCALNAVICKDSNDDYIPPADTGPATGG